MTDKNGGSGPSDKAGAAKSQMWGGRFERGPAAIMEEINASIDVDKRLWREDIEGSKAHAAMLASAGVISGEDASKITAGLDEIAAEIAAGAFPFSAALEDIHMNIEARLKEKIGAPASRLHTARSRNDQVATDFRLYIRRACDDLSQALHGLQKALLDKAEIHAATVMPGYTHLQIAQPVSFGHHCLAYVEMFERDRARFEDARRRMNECPLGAAALAGTPYPINRDMTAKALGFDRPTANSIDSVSARDFALETLAAASITASHISRLAEEIVFWTSPHFGFATLSDAYSTGSSIMPQKKNPDAAELCRAKVGRVAGAFTSLLFVMKGLPLAYSKDMQEDKAATFTAIDDMALALAAMTGMIADMTMNETAMRAAVLEGYSTATDLADYLVMELGLAFREAHHITGRIVAAAEKKGLRLDQLPLEDFRAVEPKIGEDIAARLTVDASLAARASYGGAAPKEVRRQIGRWKEILK